MTTSCPFPVWPDRPVAEELEDVPFQGYEDFWGWVARVEKLNEELEVCRDT